MANTGWASVIHPSKLEHVPPRKIRVQFKLNGQIYSAHATLNYKDTADLNLDMGAANLSGKNLGIAGCVDCTGTCSRTCSTGCSDNCSGSCGDACGNGCSGCSGPAPGERS